jgi:hypothetical protein
MSAETSAGWTRSSPGINKIGISHAAMNSHDAANNKSPPNMRRPKIRQKPRVDAAKCLHLFGPNCELLVQRRAVRRRKSDRVLQHQGADQARPGGRMAPVVPSSDAHPDT